MWPKMLLLSLNVFIHLVIANSGKIVFLNSVEKKIINNETESLNVNKTPLLLQPLITTLDNSIINKKVLIMGLLNATLNIDKSIDNLNTHDLKSDHNIIISPISIAAAMSLVLLGACNKTKTEIGKLFGFDESTLNSSTDNNNQNFKKLGSLLNYLEDNSGRNLGSHINLAKAIFVQNDFNITTNYITTVKEYLNSEIMAVNFKTNGLEAQQNINQWVSKQTNQKINDIMPDIPLPDTKTIITSALYFTGEWEYPFFVNYTRIKPFHFGLNYDGRRTSKQLEEVIYIPMMIGSSEVLYYKNDELEFKAIGLPYKGQKVITYFVLPNVNVSLRSLVSRMNGSTLKNITQNTMKGEFTYFVPKMVLKSFTNLKPVLQNIGINNIFDPIKANLSNMATEPGLYISEILHKVEIDINEIGTVGSAATVTTITRGGQTIFNINKPFLFFLHHVESDTIVFWATIHKPTPYYKIPPNQNVHQKLHPY